MTFLDAIFALWTGQAGYPPKSHPLAEKCATLIYIAHLWKSWAPYIFLPSVCVYIQWGQRCTWRLHFFMSSHRKVFSTYLCTQANNSARWPFLYTVPFLLYHAKTIFITFHHIVVVFDSQSCYFLIFNMLQTACLFVFAGSPYVELCILVPNRYSNVFV